MLLLCMPIYIIIYIGIYYYRFVCILILDLIEDTLLFFPPRKEFSIASLLFQVIRFYYNYNFIIIINFYAFIINT